MQISVEELEPGDIFDENTLKAAYEWEFPPFAEGANQDPVTLITRVEFFIEDYTRCA